MKKNILIGFLILIIIFLVPVWLTNKLHRTNTDRAITNHGESIVHTNREIISIQESIARLIEKEDRLNKRLKRCEAIVETFEKIVREKYPNFIKEGQENG